MAKKSQVNLIGRKVRILEVGKPTELLGNIKTFGSGKHDMTICEKGVHIVSKRNKEEAVIFNANCGAAKLFPEESEETK